MLAVFMGLLMRRSFEESMLSEEYVIKNRIMGHLNASAGWQAIERGYGATIIGSGEGDSYSLFLDFLEMSRKGEAEVLQAERHIKKLLSVKSDKTFEEQLNKWRRGYEALLSARPRIASNDISKEEWLNTATLNINNEVDLSNTVFLPQRTEEKILYLNTVLRPNIARLCEYAGRERALIGNTIASGEPLSNETKNEIKRYRSIVEQSLDQVLILKDLPSTSSKMKKAIEEFENEFLQSFQILRENVFISSKKQEEKIKASSVQITKRKAIFRNYLTGVSNDLLNMSNHKSVRALAEALKAEEEAHLSERLSTVENLFKAFCRVKRIYTQIRYLNNSGHECVYVDFDGNTTKIIPGTQLQDKSDRDYFKETVNLLPGGIYTSSLDLNMEHGRIEVIHKPVIRFATPVFVDGKKAGIIVFDLLANTQSFLHADTEQERKEDYILANRNGFYLHHPDESKEWGMVKTLNKSHHNIRQDYPDVAEQILSGREGSVRLVSGIVIVYKPFFLNPETASGNFWIIIKRVKKVEYPVDAPTWIDRATKAINTGLAISNIAGEDANGVMLVMESTAKRNIQIIFLTFVFTILILVLFIWWSRNRVLMPIQKLTRITQKIAEGDFSFRAEVKSNNEIGLLSSSFNKMAVDLQKSNIDLCESEAQFRSLFEQAAVGIVHVALNGQFLRVNKRFCEITGYTEQEILERTYQDITYPDDLYAQNEARKKVLDGETSSYKIEKRYIRKDGTIIWGNLTAGLVIRKPGGEPNYFVSVLEEITERRKAEEQIRKLSHAIEQSSSTVLITDTEGNIEYANSRFTQLTGYSLEEAIGKTPRILKSGKTSPEVYKKLWKAIISGNEWLGELCNRKKNGELFWEYVSISPVKNSEGIITNFIAVKDDITEQKQKDRLFLQQTRQAQMGEMLSMIAHQWRQPLTSIGAIAVNTRNRLVLNKTDKEMIIESMKRIQDHVNYLSNSINDFRTFFKPNKVKEPVSVRGIIQKCLGLISKSFEINEIKIETSYKSGRGIESYPNELIQVFLNILKNIVDVVKDRKIENAIASIREYEKDGFIVIDITDNAGGIFDDIKDNIFLPYFSTKQEKQGTGLGLYMCKTIIEEHCKGHIMAQNIKGGANKSLRISRG
ncbi:MAG: signal transduction histidine kinase [Candidatus Scalindua rubra]|uniref:histidine kinase n=1 Tax=Candidatus Scalindua rubra TaxID=1872076 RepID=A0A1E3X3C9_9BACT|nr:MAG: signal transduction histidine kinase [Candidatus Scalindua rubra]